MTEKVVAELNDGDRQRYSRQLLLPELGVEGQRRLKSASVLVVGAGGLGCPAALYLAAAGVGRLGLIDFDAVDISNLHRQILYGQSSLGARKVDAAASRLNDLNPSVDLVTHDTRLSAANAADIFSSYDAVVDGADNFAARYLVNDAAFFCRKPYVYGSIYRFEGQVSVFRPGEGPCYRCLFPSPPPPGAVPDCAAGGVLGALAGIVGSIQASECIKILAGMGSTLAGRLLVIDALAAEFSTVKMRRNPACALCASEPTIKALADEPYDCQPGPGENAGAHAGEIAPEDLETLFMGPRAPLVIDVRSHEEHRLACIDGSLNIPLDELERRSGELDAGAEIIVYCQSGQRSRQAVSILRERGFKNARSLSGGLLRWSRRHSQ